MAIHLCSYVILVPFDGVTLVSLYTFLDIRVEDVSNLTRAPSIVWSGCNLLNKKGRRVYFSIISGNSLLLALALGAAKQTGSVLYRCRRFAVT
jgi:hypothetical protein